MARVLFPVLLARRRRLGYAGRHAVAKPVPALLMGVLGWFRRFVPLAAPERSRTPVEQRLRARVPAAMWAGARRHVEDFSRGEEAGFFVCSYSRHSRGEELIAREWHPV